MSNGKTGPNTKQSAVHLLLLVDKEETMCKFRLTLVGIGQYISICVLLSIFLDVCCFSMTKVSTATDNG